MALAYPGSFATRSQASSFCRGLPLPGVKSFKQAGRKAVTTRAVLEMAKHIANGTAGTGLDLGLKTDVKDLQTDILHQAAYRVGADVHGISEQEAYRAVAWSVREHLVERFNKTNAYWKEQDPKFVYYLSAEFLMGRSLLNTVQNLGLEGPYGAAVKELGYSLEALGDAEQNAALGNGGLGRLAACFLDSIATLDLPGWGYGIRYRYGIFKQTIKDGFQVELPDIWLSNGNPWEVPRPNIKYPVSFYGHVSNGKWEPEEQVLAMAYDTPIPGYKTETVGNLRLWDALPVEEFKLDEFNKGNYVQAVDDKRKADDISAVLYPNDATEYGKELRLKQQFFFVSASIQDVMARFKEAHSDWQEFPAKAVFQLNDTHPTIAVAELMRLLVDQEGLAWDAAWGIANQTLAFTNHTVMPEALEKWPVKVIGKLLPRHMEIIERINNEWLESLRERVTKEVQAAAPPEEEEETEGEEELQPKELRPAPDAVKDEVSDAEKTLKDEVEEEEGSGKKEGKKEDPVAKALQQYSIIMSNPWEPDVKLVNMAYLAVVGSKAVNGVAAIHSEIIKETVLKTFHDVMPEKFQNKTNGVTPRRWLAYCNPELSALITEALGSDEWILHADKLAGLRRFADDPAFQKRWSDIKKQKKVQLAGKVKELTGIQIPTSSLFDIQIKRIHEYKRQHLNVFSLIYRYMQIKKMSPEQKKQVVPRVAMFGGKAASAYYMAKKIIKLVNAVGEVINNDPDVGDLLKVVFVPDYNVSLAEVLIPGAELSQHISTAGTEASGTSNMKFAMNGCLIIGTMDGANIEIAHESGRENMFIFGFDAEDLDRLRAERKDWKDYDPRWTEVMEFLLSGTFGPAEYFQDLVDGVNDMTKGNDWFLVANDFASYMDAQAEVDRVYKDQKEWTRRSILYTAGSGFFSSDRTIDQYAKEIWDVKPVRVPAK